MRYLPWARERGAGVWHLAEVSYPDEADTACGRHIEVTLFTWPQVDPEEVRPSVCRACESRTCDL